MRKHTVPRRLVQRRIVRACMRLSREMQVLRLRGSQTQACLRRCRFVALRGPWATAERTPYTRQELTSMLDIATAGIQQLIGAQKAVLAGTSPTTPVS